MNYIYTPLKWSDVKMTELQQVWKEILQHNNTYIFLNFFFFNFVYLMGICDLLLQIQFYCKANHKSKSHKWFFVCDYIFTKSKNGSEVVILISLYFMSCIYFCTICHFSEIDKI